MPTKTRREIATACPPRIAAAQAARRPTQEGIALALAGKLRQVLCQRWGTPRRYTLGTPCSAGHWRRVQPGRWTVRRMRKGSPRQVKLIRSGVATARTVSSYVPHATSNRSPVRWERSAPRWKASRSAPISPAHYRTLRKISFSGSSIPNKSIRARPCRRWALPRRTQRASPPSCKPTANANVSRGPP